jgi:hypothetical protein
VEDKELWAAVVAVSFPFGAATRRRRWRLFPRLVSLFLCVWAIIISHHLSIFYSLIVVSGAGFWLLALAPIFVSLSSRAVCFACRPSPNFCDDDDTTETFLFIRLPFLAQLRLYR